MTRHCARPGCNRAAGATLTYDYRAEHAWLDPLAPEAHPMTHDLCEQHAARLSVPRGWRLEDRRTLVELAPPAPPARQEPAAPRVDGPFDWSRLAS